MVLLAHVDPVDLDDPVPLPQAGGLGGGAGVDRPDELAWAFQSSEDITDFRPSAH